MTTLAMGFRIVAVMALTVTPGHALPKGAIRIHLADIPSADGDRSRMYLNQNGLASETASATMNKFSGELFKALELSSALTNSRNNDDARSSSHKHRSLT
jgi:hypothetical protein